MYKNNSNLSLVYSCIISPYLDDVLEEDEFPTSITPLGSVSLPPHSIN